MKKFDFLSQRYVGYTISAALFVLTIVLYFTPAFSLKYGVDFKGGTELHFKFNKPVADDKIRQILKDDCGLSGVVQSTYTGDMPGGETVLLRGESREKIIKTDFLANEAYKDKTTGLEVKSLKDMREKFEAGLAKLDKDLKIEDTLRETSVGPAVGSELRTQAVFAVMVALIGILLYITYTFEFKFAIPAILALFHDVIIVLGVIMLARIEFDMSQLAVLLTVVGYSINDTIIICDRIRENFKIMRKTSYYDMVNESLAQVFSRTVITVLTTLLPLISIFFFGGEVLSGFALTMMCGMIVGCYSSIFVVSPIIVIWKTYEEKAVA
ncbi:MAG: protein-export membrane protein SecF [Candidatus Wallbacteria bacterium GWC2_49_35]|uniref:Protein-export membrane protein SecF n=1 Tax=Candidatus Wallbacteria bacterium GWC2_49_35 TaxID=1817813 RepID=A0A1F7WHN4_9BACT|nr:MAG: protein-export membrane protein SecF [Candidatus Wallbacteria bacterium GWC2_49_35]HBC73555.1 protein translocase subunit SecF [Candidatus Wallbacteria bacterium]